MFIVEVPNYKTKCLWAGLKTDFSFMSITGRLLMKPRKYKTTVYHSITVCLCVCVCSLS